MYSNILICRGSSYLYGLHLIPTWISYHIHHIIWDEITYPFPDFNGCTVWLFSHAGYKAKPCWWFISANNFLPHWIQFVQRYRYQFNISALIINTTVIQILQCRQKPHYMYRLCHSKDITHTSIADAYVFHFDSSNPRNVTLSNATDIVHFTKRSTSVLNPWTALVTWRQYLSSLLHALTETCDHN